jgi:hypothetical protein
MTDEQDRHFVQRKPLFSRSDVKGTLRISPPRISYLIIALREKTLRRERLRVFTADQFYRGCSKNESEERDTVR